MKAVKAHLATSNPERVEAFEKEAQEAAKKIIANFKDYEFYVGESMNPDGSVNNQAFLPSTILSRSDASFFPYFTC
jgi:hypothetical protein